MKKLLSLLLSIFMVATCVSCSSNASAVKVARIDGTEYSTLAAAIDAAKESGEETFITLINNVVESIEVPEGISIAIDLDGYTLTAAEGSNYTVKNNGSLVFYDGSDDMTGAIINNNSIEGESCVIENNETGTLTLWYVKLVGSNNLNSIYGVINYNRTSLVHATVTVDCESVNYGHATGLENYSEMSSIKSIITAKSTGEGAYAIFNDEGCEYSDVGDTLYVENSYEYGCAIGVYNLGTAVLDSITAQATSPYVGDGIYLCSTEGSTTISGDMNLSGDSFGLYTKNGVDLRIGEAGLSNENPITSYMTDLYDTCTFATGTNCADCVDKFKFIDSLYAFASSEGDKIEITARLSTEENTKNSVKVVANLDGLNYEPTYQWYKLEELRADDFEKSELVGDNSKGLYVYGTTKEGTEVDSIENNSATFKNFYISLTDECDIPVDYVTFKCDKKIESNDMTYDSATNTYKVYFGDRGEGLFNLSIDAQNDENVTITDVIFHHQVLVDGATSTSFTATEKGEYILYAEFTDDSYALSDYYKLDLAA